MHNYITLFNKEKGAWKIVGWPAGLGSIEIAERMGSASESHRHDFVVTQLPSLKGRRSLHGFYVTSGRLYVIQADFWKAGRPFTSFDTYLSEIVRGTCE